LISDIENFLSKAHSGVEHFIETHPL